MRALIMSDIHANIVALETVLADAGPVDETWCLGDLVGYGPNPNEVVARLRNLPNLTCLLGNHDAAVIEMMPHEAFNGDARRSLEWQKSHVAQETIDFLRGLTGGPLLRGAMTLVHGSPRDPIWEYVINSLVARLNFDAFSTDFCMVGHSHVQCAFFLDAVQNRVVLEIPRVDEPYTLKPRSILNPGSVGQPRDRDSRAAYAIYDDQNLTWTARRAVYDVAEVQRRVRAAGLPDRHAARLSEGW